MRLNATQSTTENGSKGGLLEKINRVRFEDAYPKASLTDEASAERDRSASLGLIPSNSMPAMSFAGAGFGQDGYDRQTPWHNADGTSAPIVTRTAKLAGALDAMEVAAASDRAFYRDAEFNATNGFSAVGWHIGGLLNHTGYDLATTARGAYRLATDANTRATAYSTLKYAANNPGVVLNSMIQGFKNFSNKPLGEQADSLFKFGAGGLATAGTGKLGMLAVNGAVTGAATTARWFAPKAGELIENYIGRTRGLAFAVDPGVGANVVVDSAMSTERIAFICRSTSACLSREAAAADRPCWTEPPPGTTMIGG